ncbi:MAG: DUF4118 domain-containing protein [Chitinophagaceae bacterium]|nr:DUF4118 domain-containing protein [Chitinophagaceae bacterium]
MLLFYQLYLGFLFIPPHYTIHVDSTEDAILLIMYFIIAMVNAVLHKIRQVEKLARLREEKAKAGRLYNTFLNSLSHELKHLLLLLSAPPTTCK